MMKYGICRWIFKIDQPIDEIDGKVDNGMISLIEPGKFTLKLEPKAINSLLNHQVELKEESRLSLVFEELNLPLQFLEGIEVDPCQISIKSSLELSPTLINDYKITGLNVLLSSPLCAKEIKIDIQGKGETKDQPYDLNLSLTAKKPLQLKEIENLKEELWKGSLKASTPSISIFIKDLLLNSTKKRNNVSGILNLLKADGTPYPLIDEPVPFTVFFEIGIPINFTAQLSAPSLNGNLEGKIEQNQLVLLHPVQLNYTLRPEGLKELGHLTGKELPILLAPSQIEIKIDPAQISLQNALATLAVKGIVNIDRLSLQDVSKTTVTFENLTMPWVINNQLEVLTVKLNGQAYTNLNEKRTRLAIKLNTQRLFSEGKLNFKNAKYEILSELFGIPTSLISHFISTQDISPLLGPIMDIELKTAVDMASSSPGYWDMFIDSANLSAKARIKIEDSITLYKSNKPTAQIKLTVTPESYSFLKKMISNEETKNAMTLSQPVVLTAFLNDLDLPLKKGLSWADQGKIVGEFETSEIGWNELKLQPFILKGSLNSNNLSDKIDFSFSGTSEGSSLTMQGVLTQFLSPYGKMQKYDQIAVKTELGATQFPIAWLQSLLVFKDTNQRQIQALLGDKVDAKATIQLNNLNGSVKANLSGSNGSGKFDGKVTNGILTLAAPFQWQVKVTPQLGKDLFQMDMPLLSSIVSSEKPILLSIDPANFSCPLIPFDFNKIKIGKGYLDLGKVTFRNEGEIKTVLNLIKPIPENQFVIWFTPLYFNMEKSVLNLNRIDLLVANMYTLAAWGKIDLDSHKMDLILGISDQALRYAFNIQGLAENYMLQIPIKGRNGHIEIDKTKLTARITALLAQTQANSNMKLLGSIVDMALSEGSAPKPTTNPLPWANQFVDKSPKEESKQQNNSPSTENAKSKQDQTKKKKKMDAGDLIEKGASTLLNRFLK